MMDIDHTLKVQELHLSDLSRPSIKATLNGNLHTLYIRRAALCNQEKIQIIHAPFNTLSAEELSAGQGPLLTLRSGLINGPPLPLLAVVTIHEELYFIQESTLSPCSPIDVINALEASVTLTFDT